MQCIPESDVVCFFFSECDREYTINCSVRNSRVWKFSLHANRSACWLFMRRLAGTERCSKVGCWHIEMMKKKRSKERGTNKIKYFFEIFIHLLDILKYRFNLDLLQPESDHHLLDCPKS
jgi:hypothetical protein